jgi:hypothetical protein
MPAAVHDTGAVRHRYSQSSVPAPSYRSVTHSNQLDQLAELDTEVSHPANAGNAQPPGKVATAEAKEQGGDLADAVDLYASALSDNSNAPSDQGAETSSGNGV